MGEGNGAIQSGGGLHEDTQIIVFIYVMVSVPYIYT
jgi:hypothetical protein